MLIWIVLFLTTFLGAGYIAFHLGQRLGGLPGRGRGAMPISPEPAGLIERSIRDVRPRDVVQVDTRDWLVEGVVRYEEDGRTWRAARTTDGREERWFVVGMDPDPTDKPIALAPAPDLELTTYPPDTLHHHGQRYELGRRGTATVKLEGDLGGLASGAIAPGASLRCRWWRYEGPAERALLVEQWGERYRALAGGTIEPHELDFLGGSSA